MRHILIRELERPEFPKVLDCARFTLGHQMFDADVLNHRPTTVFEAMSGRSVLGHLPVTQPVMLESAFFGPNLTETEKALVMTKLAEHAIEECMRRDAGEVYFLCQNAQTAKFAARHHFKRLDLPLYRFNLREWQDGE